MRLSLQEASRMRPTLSGPDRSAEHDGDVARQTDAPTDGGEPPDLDQTTRQVLLDAMNSVAEQLIHEISLCLRYYTVTFRGQRVGSALVSGVGAETPLLLDTCKRHLPCDVAVAQSFRGLRKVGRLSREGQTEWAIAIGLALKGIESAAPEQEDVPRTSQLISVG